MFKEKNISSYGFTLIEVLLAIVILSIGMSALMISNNESLRIIKTTYNHEVAQNLIQRLQHDFPINKINLEERIESGTFENFPKFEWEREILMFDSEKIPGLFLIKNRINWSQSGKKYFEEVILYTYAPEAEIISNEI